MQTIKVGDMPLQNINPHVWRARTGSVMQDGFNVIIEKVAEKQKKINFCVSFFAFLIQTQDFVGEPTFPDG
jgi:hypothetical protein